MNTLSKEDKISIINQHKRNIEYSKYNIEISIIEEESVDSPSESSINSLKEQLSELDKD